MMNKIYKFIRLITIPLIPLYLVVHYAKRFMGKPEKFGVPVICVGNITTGGTGKTPAVIEFAKLFIKAGLRPVIVSRGYRGSKSKDGALVTDGNAIFLTPFEAGDEPCLMAKALTGIPIAVCANRAKAIGNLLGRFNIDLILLDDGFQNNSIYKDINIVIIDATNPFGNGLVLPAGDMREPAVSLRRADIIIINKSDLIPDDKLNVLKLKIQRNSGNQKIFHSVYGNEILIRMKNFNKKFPVEEIKNKNILLVSAIGNPEAFKKTINKCRPASIKAIIYPDHHSYSSREIEKIVAESARFDLIITTEKDSIKMQDFQLPDNFYFISVSFVIKELDAFKDSIISLLKISNKNIFKNFYSKSGRAG